MVDASGAEGAVYLHDAYFYNGLAHFIGSLQKVRNE